MGLTVHRIHRKHSAHEYMQTSDTQAQLYKCGSAVFLGHCARHSLKAAIFIHLVIVLYFFYIFFFTCGIYTMC